VEPRLDVCYVNEHVAPSQGIAQSLLKSEHFSRLIEEAVSADLELYAWMREQVFPSYQRRFRELTGADASGVEVDNRLARFRKNWYLNLAYRNVVYRPLLLLRRIQVRNRLEVN